VTGFFVQIGSDVLTEPRCYFAGRSNYNTDCTDIPMSQQGIKEESGIELGDDIWLGANVTVLYEVTIGDSSIVGAGAEITSAISIN